MDRLKEETTIEVEGTTQTKKTQVGFKVAYVIRSKYPEFEK